MSGSTTTISDDRLLLLRLVEESYNRSTWNETNLRSSIKGVSADEAAWTPPHARHNIAEIVLHCAYWKYMVRRRLLGDRRRTFPLKGRDWFSVAAPLAEDDWSGYRVILDDEHERLCDTVLHVERELLHSSDSGREPARQVFGVAMHDTYHTGQVRLIRAMYQRTREA